MSPLESTAAAALRSPIKTRSLPADGSVNADRNAHPGCLSASSLLVRTASSVHNEGCMEELREENSPGSVNFRWKVCDRYRFLAETR